MFFSIREFNFFNVERASMRGKNVFHARGFDAGVINARFLQHEGDRFVFFSIYPGGFRWMPKHLKTNTITRIDAQLGSDG